MHLVLCVVINRLCIKWRQADNRYISQVVTKQSIYAIFLFKNLLLLQIKADIKYGNKISIYEEVLVPTLNWQTSYVNYNHQFRILLRSKEWSMYLFFSLLFSKNSIKITLNVAELCEWFESYHISHRAKPLVAWKCITMLHYRLCYSDTPILWVVL